MEFNCEGKNKVADFFINCDDKKFIVFFEKKLLAISLEKTFIKATNKELKKMFISERKGFFERIGKADKYWETFGERFLYMSSEEIADKFNKTVVIEFIDVKKYLIRPFKRNGTITDGMTEDKRGDIEIKSKEKGKKISFEHHYALDEEKYKKLISCFEKKAINADGYIEK